MEQFLFAFGLFFAPLIVAFMVRVGWELGGKLMDD